MAAIQHSMARYFDAKTVVLLDAMIEGLTLHRALGGEPKDPRSILDGVRCVAFGALDN